MKNKEDIEIKSTELSSEELAQVEGGSWFCRPETAQAEPGIVSPAPGAPMCFRAKGKKGPVSICRTPGICPYRKNCENNKNSKK